VQHRSVLWTKGTLLASASVLAIAISVPQAIAADMPVKAPPMHTYAPAPVVNPWTWWVEGGAQGLVGDPYVPGFTPPFDAEPKSWGWSAAIGFDYRFNAAWHLSAAFRYGSNKTKTSTSTQNGLFGPGVPITTVTTGTVVGTGPNSASRKEYNWTADFAVGRDIGIGIGTSQVKVGVRVAQIRGKTDGSASWSVPSFFGGTTSSSSYHQTNKFTGAGPRIAIEGNAPISGPWSLDYMAGNNRYLPLHLRLSAQRLLQQRRCGVQSGCNAGHFLPANAQYAYILELPCRRLSGWHARLRFWRQRDQYQSRLPRPQPAAYRNVLTGRRLA
jgi:hypothetical protein